MTRVARGGWNDEDAAAVMDGVVEAADAFSGTAAVGGGGADASTGWAGAGATAGTIAAGGATGASSAGDAVEPGGLAEGTAAGAADPAVPSAGSFTTS